MKEMSGVFVCVNRAFVLFQFQILSFFRTFCIFARVFYTQNGEQICCVQAILAGGAL